MAGSLNKVMLIGNLGADPEVQTTPSGAQVATFRVACSESWTDQSGQRQEKTEWITVKAWRKTAEIVQKYLRKGSKVYIEGKLTTRSWEDKSGGGKRYATEVVCDRMLMLDGKGNGGQGGQGGGYGGQGDFAQNGDDFDAPPAGTRPASAPDDDLPF